MRTLSETASVNEAIYNALSSGRITPTEANTLGRILRAQAKEDHSVRMAMLKLLIARSSR
jgi:hypothetical protein